MKITYIRLIIAGLLITFLISIGWFNHNLVFISLILWVLAFKMWSNEHKALEARAEQALKNTEMMAKEYAARQRSAENPLKQNR